MQCREVSSWRGMETSIIFLSRPYHLVIGSLTEGEEVWVLGKPRTFWVGKDQGVQAQRHAYQIREWRVQVVVPPIKKRGW